MVKQLESSAWKDHSGRLEEIFMQTLEETGAAGR
jgi:hypothetical protein